MPYISNGESGLSVRTKFNNRFAKSLDASFIGVTESNSGAANKAALQQAMDDLSDDGGEILFDSPVPMEGGLILRDNVYLIGNNMAGFKGPRPAGGAAPSLGSIPSTAAFLVEDEDNPFITVLSNTMISGFTIFYPGQNWATTNPANLVVYPPTIKKDATYVQSCSFQRICFVGNTECIDFTPNNSSQDIEMDLLYGYPTSGRFITMREVFDIPRITRCHVNPGAGRVFLGAIPYTFDICNYIAGNGDPSFSLEAADEYMLSQNFVFANKIAFRILNSYGSISQCESDMVQTGFWITSSANHKVTEISDASVVLGGGLRANRDAILFDGIGGGVTINGLSAFVGSNEVVSSSNSPGANSLIRVAGSGQQIVQAGSGLRTGQANGGTFDQLIDQDNGDAIITYSGAVQNNVEAPRKSGFLSNLLLDGINLSGAVVPTPVGIDVPDSLIRIDLNGTKYDLFCKEVPPVETTTFNDTFTDTNGTALPAHSPEVGGPWVNEVAGWEIQGNAASCSVDDAVCNVAVAGANGILTANVNVPSGKNIAITFRRIDQNNYLRFQVNSAGVSPQAYFIKRFEGVDEIVDQTAVTFPAASDVEMKVVTSGTNVQCYLGGSPTPTFDKTVYQLSLAVGIGIKGTAVATVLDLEFVEVT